MPDGALLDADGAAERRGAPTPIDPRRVIGEWWPAIIGFAALAVPTIVSLSGRAWARESAAHGPLVLVTGAWLLWRQMTAARDETKRGSMWITMPLLIASLALYVVGRVFDFASFEAGGLLGVGVTLLYNAFGASVMLKNWFPVFYLAFAIPPPGSVIDRITAPLKQFVSETAMRAAHLLGIPASREGVTIYVSKYQLLMEDACSGMNSLVGLTAISLLYIYLLRGSSVRYSLLMTAFVIPIAIVGNIMRVVILILLTYFGGDELAQGFLHYTAGFLLFGLDLIIVFAVDSALMRVVPRSWTPAQ